MAAHAPAGPPPITSTSVESVPSTSPFGMPISSDAGAELVRGNRETVVLPQRGALVVLAEQPLAPEDRQHVLDEGLQLRRQRGRHDVEAVGGATLEPRDDGVGGLVGRADEREVATTAAE